jgi:hypothetical protein
MTTTLSRINGNVLVMFVAALLVATWPFFGTFTIATLITGLCMSIAMQLWHEQHPATAFARGGTHALPAEINLASIPVRDDAGGLFFAVGSVLILMGLPPLRWFLLGSIVCAVLAAFVMIAVRRPLSRS